jgi:hypothetical protein
MPQLRTLLGDGSGIEFATKIIKEASQEYFTHEDHEPTFERLRNSINEGRELVSYLRCPLELLFCLRAFYTTYEGQFLSSSCTAHRLDLDPTLLDAERHLNFVAVSALRILYGVLTYLDNASDEMSPA